MHEEFHIDGSGQKPDDNEKFFSAHIADSSRSMVSIINRSYVYEKVNKPFRSAHKGVIKSFVGRSLADVWGEETFRNKIKNKIDLCFTGKTVRYEAAFNTPKSGHRYFEVVFRPLRSHSGEVTHLMAETFDVTVLKQSKKITSELQRQARKKDLDFSNRLLQAQRLETIGVLAGGIAHDFNNILATISGYAEMLRDDLPKDPLYLERTEKILSAVKRARFLTNQILTFSRQTDQVQKQVDVNAILKETLDFLKTVIPSRISISANIPEIKFTVFADPTQLFRVFLNLMTNAVQSMEGKGGTLSVKLSKIRGTHIRTVLKKESVAGEYVLITFKDTGIGMDNSLLPRIFDPFFTTREIGKGTGLGLSVAYGIVTEMGGEILVSSKRNKGSVFEVYIPVSGEEATPGSNEKS